MAEDSAVVDALPYYDVGYDQSAKEDAERLIAAEMESFRPSRNYLRHLPALNLEQWETDITKAEFSRREKDDRKPRGPSVDMSRYSTSAPPAYKKRDPLAWHEPLQRERIIASTTNTRLKNIELDDQHMAHAWLAYNGLLSKTVQRAQIELEAVRQRTAVINWNRKVSQEKVGRQLTDLDDQWITFITKSYQLRAECDNMQAEVDRLKKLRQIAAEASTS